MLKESPDGSLYRITSSAKDLINNVKIVKVPDSIPSYKLVIIKNNENFKEDSESSEEISDDELFDIKLPSKNCEKEKVVDTKNAKFDKPKKIHGEGGTRERNHYNRHQPYHNKNNNRYYGRRNNHFNKTSKKYNNRPNREEIYNYSSRDFNSRANRDFTSTSNKDYNSAAKRECSSAPKRDFSSTANNHATYNADHYQHSLQHPSDDFSSPTWIKPPVMFTNYSHLSISHAVISENPRSSVGLLGDRPSYVPPVPIFQSNKKNDNYIHDQNSTYTPMASNFQSDTISDNFICDQTSPYPPMTSNNHSNSFIHNQSSPYSPVTSNYPASKQTDKFVHDQNYWNDSYSNYNKSNQHRNKHFNVKNNQKQNTWNKNSRRHPNVCKFCFISLFNLILFSLLIVA